MPQSLLNTSNRYIFVQWLKFYIAHDPLIISTLKGIALTPPRYSMASLVGLQNCWEILFLWACAGHVHWPHIVAKNAPLVFTWEQSKKVFLINISNPNLIRAKYAYSFIDFITLLSLIFYWAILKCWIVWSIRLTVNTYRGYPAKRALSAMRKHGG